VKPDDISDVALVRLYRDARKTMDLPTALRHVAAELDRPRCAGLAPEVVAVANEVAVRFNTTRDLLLGRTEKNALKRGRVIAWWLLHYRFDMSYPKIGKAFWGRDHSTVLQMVAELAEEMRHNAGTLMLVQDIEAAAYRRLAAVAGEMQRRAA